MRSNVTPVSHQSRYAYARCQTKFVGKKSSVTFFPQICTSNRSIGGDVTQQNNDVYMHYPYTVVSSLDLDDELLSKQNLLLVSDTSPPKANNDVVDAVKNTNYERGEYYYNGTATNNKLSHAGANGPPPRPSSSASIELIEGAAAITSANATSSSNPTKGFNGNCRRGNNGVNVETAEDYV